MINREKQRQTLKQISFVVIALAAILAFPRLTAQEAKERREAAINHAYVLPQRFALEWKIGLEAGEPPSDEWRLCLTAVNVDRRDRYYERGYDPSHTYMLCDYKPIAKKLKNGKWEITFVSEIAEKVLPLPSLP